MANRISGNVYIIDSQTGAGAALMPGSSSWPLHSAKIQSVAFWSSDTTGLWEMVFAADTTSIAFKITPDTAPIPVSGAVMQMIFDCISFDELRCKTLTAGTGFIYFA